MVLGIIRSQVTIAAADWQQTLSFYQNLLQLPPQGLLPDRYAEFRLPDLTLILYFPKPEERPELAVPHPSLSLCFYVESLEAAIAQLQAHGIPMTEPIQRSSHGQEIYLYDPNGNRIILYQPNSSAT
ncbi:MAG: hypothetical protein RLZZ511_2986 [Cyanobacteriota bacterium]|jgi:catechol 2,3-dioxygenase-like lactoylglutathione lyase family enzyme